VPDSNYTILSEIGRGGFAVVSLAEPASSGEKVALKRPLPVSSADDRMRREIDVQRRLAGPHVMPILDLDQDAPWFTMPVAEGNLYQLCIAVDLGTTQRTGPLLSSRHWLMDCVRSIRLE
jgi:serine/threonine protein kinase